MPPIVLFFKVTDVAHFLTCADAPFETVSTPATSEAGASTVLKNDHLFFENTFLVFFPHDSITVMGCRQNMVID
jgi:hypothetical protein